MNHIQTDVSDEALVTAIRANLCDFFRYLGKSTPDTYHQAGTFRRWHTPLAHPWFNGVLSSAPAKEKDDIFIEESIQYFRAKNINIFTWWMDPHLTRSDWEPALSKHGFHFSDDTPGMAIDLQTLDESKGKVDGLEIRAVDDEESLRTWVKVFTPGYGLPAAWEDAIFDLWLKLGMDLPLRNYLGFLNGEPVSTSCLFIGGDVAGIYSVATLPHARGKGIGAALTMRPLLDVRKMGHRIGVLQSSDMGYNIYKRLGFRHMCQIENFYLRME